MAIVRLALEGALVRAGALAREHLAEFPDDPLVVFVVTTPVRRRRRPRVRSDQCCRGGRLAAGERLVVVVAALLACCDRDAVHVGCRTGRRPALGGAQCVRGIRAARRRGSRRPPPPPRRRDLRARAPGTPPRSCPGRARSPSMWRARRRCEIALTFGDEPERREREGPRRRGASRPWREDRVVPSCTRRRFGRGRPVTDPAPSRGR